MDGSAGVTKRDWSRGLMRTVGGKGTSAQPQHATADGDGSAPAGTAASAISEAQVPSPTAIATKRCVAGEQAIGQADRGIRGADGAAGAAASSRSVLQARRNKLACAFATEDLVVGESAIDRRQFASAEAHRAAVGGRSRGRVSRTADPARAAALEREMDQS